MKKLLIAGVTSTAILIIIGAPITAAFSAGAFTAAIAWRAAK